MCAAALASLVLSRPDAAVGSTPVLLWPQRGAAAAAAVLATAALPGGVKVEQEIQFFPPLRVVWSCVAPQPYHAKRSPGFCVWAWVRRGRGFHEALARAAKHMSAPLIVPRLIVHVVHAGLLVYVWDRRAIQGFLATHIKEA